MCKFSKVFLVGCALALATISVGAQDDTNILDALARPMDFEARRASSSNADINKNGDARGIEPGATLVLMDEDGPGIITHFWSTIAAYDPYHPRSVVLRVYYDGNENPSIEAPLGDFFGVGHGVQKDFTSQPVAVSSHGRSRTCYWRMPFRKHVKVTVANESEEHKVDSFYYYLDWQKHETLPEDTPYFHARYRQAHPAPPGRHTLLETEGRGHYVGTVYSAHQMELGWFGEGDDFFFIDGAETPQLKGTGTEDYFNDAWGFREFCTPYHGVTLYEGVLPGDRVTAYRWHIPDPIPFKESLRVEIEHRGSVFNEKGSMSTFQLGNFEERPDWISSVAFWYQHPAATFAEGLPPAEERIAPYRVIRASELTYRAEPPFLVVPDDPFLVYVPNTPEASIEFDFELEEDGRYRIDGLFIHGIIGGVFQASLDGEPIGGPMDMVIVNYDPVWRSLDTHDLEAGKHTLRFEGRDMIAPAARKLAPKFYAFGVAALSLLRLEDMEGYHQLLDRLMEEK